MIGTRGAMAAFLAMALSSSVASADSLKPGAHVILYRDGVERVFLATTDAAWDELLDAENAQSVELLARLSEQGKLLMPKCGTKATVIKAGFSSVRVLITTGEWASGEGWIQREYVVSEKPSEPVIPPADAPGGPNDRSGAIIAILGVIVCAAVLFLIGTRGRIPRRPKPQPDWRTDPESYRRWQAKHGG